MKKNIEKETECGHYFEGLEQMRRFGRDQCVLCNEWVHKEELIEFHINQIKKSLVEIERLIISPD